MPISNTYPNQRIAAPYGDIYAVPTNYTDALLNKIDKQKEQQRKDDTDAEDAIQQTFSKDIAGVRAVDIPELTKRYAAYKQSEMANIANRRKGRGISPDESIAAMQKQSEVYDIIAKVKDTFDVRIMRYNKPYVLLRSKHKKNKLCI